MAVRSLSFCTRPLVFSAFFLFVFASESAFGFTDIDAGLTAVSFSSATWGDYDSDGDLDILLAGKTDDAEASIVYRNDDGTFVDIGAGLIGVVWSFVAWGDYDNDGDLDVLLSGHTGVDGVVSENSAEAIMSPSGGNS
jgi:hypothetical protein